MSPCNPNDVTINVPDGPSGPAIPGFGRPFSLSIPDVSLPEGFPEDLLEILDLLQLLVPPGAFKPSLNPNFGKDIFDAIMKLLDQFMPFLMLYKFFLPILNIIICIIEVLCALTNPFKLIRALKRLFRVCIPEFLNLFPIFALIIMIISLLLLLLALIEYIINQILKFIKLILRNINALVKAFRKADANAILAIAKKLGAVLCIFQNLFVLLSIFNIIIQIIKDILSMLFSIPPCDDADPDDEDGCCTPDVCPAIVKSEYTRETGIFQYYPRASQAVSGFASLMVDIRPESWQLYDPSQEQAQEFINIINAFDVTNVTPKPIFFPTDSVYTKDTTPKQAPYVIDLRLFYDPADWGRAGDARYIRFNNCIMTLAPTDSLSNYDVTTITTPTGVARLAGGAGFEDDGTTPLTGFAEDGVTPIGSPGTLENFIHMAANVTVNPTVPTLLITDGHTFTDVTYTFKPNMAVLLNKTIVTAGCEPSLALTKSYINQAFAGDIGVKTLQLRGLFDDTNPATGLGFPDPDACQACLAAALAALKNNLTVEGVAEFQTTTNLCLQKLKDETNGALGSLIAIGFEACKSDFVVDPPIQFTSKPIKVNVNLKERNGLPLTNSLSPDVALELANKISAHLTFGQITPFTYDGSQSFTADLTSDHPGEGDVMISFDGNIFCTNNIPDDVDEDPTRTLQSLAYQFVYTPVAENVPGTGEGDTDGKPLRNVGGNGGDA